MRLKIKKTIIINTLNTKNEKVNLFFDDDCFVGAYRLCQRQQFGTY
jgi:hypothetical protein